jgi:hypothetical protein
VATWVVGGFFSVMGALFVLAYATRNLDDPRELTGWARAHGVELSAANIGLVRYFVRLVVVLRVTGGLGGLLVGSLLDDAVGWHTSEDGGAWVWALCGWMAGAWWADRSVAPSPGPGAGASLAPRRLGHYLPRFLLLAPAGGAALAVALATAAVADPAPGIETEPWILAAVAAVAVAIAGAAAGAQRSVVARPQPALTADVVAADDAVRATAIHHLGGGATAATLLLAAGLATRPELAGPDGLRIGLFGVSLFGAVVAWRYLAFRGWRVRRTPWAPGPSVGAAR